MASGLRRNHTGFYASAGPRLTRYDADIQGGRLTARESITLPLDIQYAWPHPEKALAYFAISNGGPGSRGDTHALAVCRLGGGGGTSLLDGTVPLPARPLHLSLDRTAAHLLVAYNDPSAITIHAVNPDGTVGCAIPQPAGLDYGIFGHQVRVTPDGGAVLFPCRGHDARGDHPEQPGMLQVFGCTEGRLSRRQEIAPGGGYGFGPRHLDFHPDLPLLFLGLERQNQVWVFRYENGSVHPEPLARTTTVTASGEGRQAVAAIHVHPGGRLLYVSNRCYGLIDTPDGPLSPPGENAIAVFDIETASGRLRHRSSVPTGGYLPRTFSIDPGGRMLVAANSETTRMRTATGDIEDVPLSLSAFTIAPDGALAASDRITIPERGCRLFWAGFL